MNKGILYILEIFWNGLQICVGLFCVMASVVIAMQFVHLLPKIMFFLFFALTIIFVIGMYGEDVVWQRKWSK